jgi:hypothetical protein
MPKRLPSVKRVTCAAVWDNSDWMIVGVDHGFRAVSGRSVSMGSLIVPFIPGMSVELTLTNPSGPPNEEGDDRNGNDMQSYRIILGL